MLLTEISVKTFPYEAVFRRLKLFNSHHQPDIPYHLLTWNFGSGYMVCSSVNFCKCIILQEGKDWLLWIFLFDGEDFQNINEISFVYLRETLQVLFSFNYKH